jgi:epoxyqueuosine reductase QueG
LSSLKEKDEEQMSLQKEWIFALKKELHDQGASVVAFADLHELSKKVHQKYPYGISIGVALNPKIVTQIVEGPTSDYEAEYNRVNHLLGTLAELGAQYLQKQGFKASPTATTTTKIDGFVTALPHKTVATRAGVGWIGKCALLVTKEFGSAIRLTTVLTDAKLPSAPAVNNSACGSCQACVDVCPIDAPTGIEWYAGIPQDRIYDVSACRRQTEQWLKTRDLTHRICGMCIAACPWTQQYLKQSR